MPAFLVLAYEDMTIKPWEQASESSGFNASIVDEWGGGRPNVWGERGDTERLLRGHPEAAKYLATKLLQAEFDTAYAYRPLHHPGAGARRELATLSPIAYRAVGCEGTRNHQRGNHEADCAA